MYVVIINFPPIKEGKEAEFRQWFAWGNKEFAKFEGLISRRLLKPVKGGNYGAIVEHESRETHMAMHDSPARRVRETGRTPLRRQTDAPGLRRDHRIRWMAHRPIYVSSNG